MENWVKTATASVAGLLTFLFGSPDMWFLALISFVVIDYITGVFAAYINRELSSTTGFRGIAKKLLFFAIVSIAHILDNATGCQGVLRSIVVGFLVANEGLSILENCGRAGLPIPKQLTDALRKLKGSGE